MKALSFCVLCVVSIGLTQEKSGPPVGEPLPAFKVFDVTGPNKGKELDYLKEFKGAPTLIIFFNRWDRPPARFLKHLDTFASGDEAKGLKTLAVFLTGDVEMQKDYLPRAHTSLQLESFPLTVFLGPKEGPREYKLSDKADVTVVLAKNDRVVESRGIISVNETDAPPVVGAAKKLLEKE